jgi:hypothetical protein
MEDVEIWRRLYISELEARLVLCEIRRGQMTAQINSPDTTRKQRTKAVAERDRLIVEWGTIMTELEEQKDRALAKF